MTIGIREMRFAVTSVLLLCAIATQTRAATITVTNTNDSGLGSLRQALADANDGDTINFAITGTITLTSDGLLIAKNVAISGPGPVQVSIDGNQMLFVFGVFPEKTATISGLTITNGQIGIWNEEAALTLSNCAVSTNSLGGVYNDFGSLTVNSCVVSGNSYYGLDNNGFQLPLPTDQGPGVAALVINDTIISNNSGSGVWNTGNVTIINSTLAGNSAQGDFGGGIRSGSFKAIGSAITVINSAITGNSAQGGGGVSNDYGHVSVVNSTISGNSATVSGGGIANNAGTVQISNSTMSGNSAGSGGGLYNAANQFGGTVEIGNTIFDAGISGENILNDGGTVTSHGYNLSSDDGGGFLNGPGDQINTDPLLGPLQDNGGPTLTQAPLPGSPAIDAGDPNFTPPPLRDQRGICFHRVFRRLDVGSVETQPEPRCPTPRPRPTPR